MDLGADDYLAKPFHLAELNARVKSVIRRNQQDGNIGIELANLNVYPDRHTVQVNGSELTLNRKEFDLLYYFVTNPDRLINKTTLAESVWGDRIDQADSLDFIYSQVKNLRKKMKHAGAIPEIKAIYGFGYKLTTHPENYEITSPHACPSFCPIDCNPFRMAYLFYLNILDEIMDETDDTLENTKELIIKQSLRNGVVTGEHKDVMTHYSIREISPQEAENYKEHYFNSTRFYEVELEDDPVRVLKTSFKSKENRYYELTIMISTLEQDDMIEAMIQWIIILYVSLLITILIVTEIVFRKSLRPLHKLLKWLDSFTLGTNCKPLDNQTKIKEFKQLNTTIEKMTRRNEELYAQQRQFIENASHELQTPLAICQNKLEMLAEKTEGNEEMLQEIEEIQKNIGRSVKLNKSLLLLSRIENGQFHEEKEV